MQQSAMQCLATTCSQAVPNEQHLLHFASCQGLAPLASAMKHNVDVPNFAHLEEKAAPLKGACWRACGREYSLLALRDTSSGQTSSFPLPLLSFFSNSSLRNPILAMFVRQLRQQCAEPCVWRASYACVGKLLTEVMNDSNVVAAP